MVPFAVSLSVPAHVGRAAPPPPRAPASVPVVMSPVSNAAIVLVPWLCESSTTDGAVAVPPRSVVSRIPPVTRFVASGSTYVPGGVEHVGAAVSLSVCA